MNRIAIFLYEWKHLIRNPFKIVAILLFVMAGVWALNNGAALHHEQTLEIEKINKKIAEKEQETLAYFEKGETGPADRPWIDLSTPFWAIWNTSVYHCKSPSPAMVYSIGQAEQYGFYKKITLWSSPYDADLAGEIANPERIQSGTLDFSFVILYLLPLLLLVCLHNVKGTEEDRGILKLIQTQVSSQRPWVISRVLFYGLVIFLTVVALLVYGATLTGVLEEASSAFGMATLLSLVYLLLWLGLYSLVLIRGNSTITITLSMVGVWILFAFVIPAAAQQIVGIRNPVGMMTELTDAQRDDREQLWELPDSLYQEKVIALFPEIKESPVYQDTINRSAAMNRSAASLANELVKSSILEIEATNLERNDFIQVLSWINPVTLFQNQFNQISETHYQNYADYRNEIQTLIDLQIRVMVLDTWNGLEVNKDKYLSYKETLNQLPKSLN